MRSWFAQMRQDHPVFFDEQSEFPSWNVFRYDDVATVLTDHARFSSRVFGVDMSVLSDTVLGKDPPDHRKLRNLVNLAFTPRAVQQLSERIAGITRELLDRVRHQGEMDIVADLAAPLPMRVILDMLGAPASDLHIFQRWAADDLLGAAPEAAVSREMHSYFSGLLEERRRSPRQDLVTALANAEIDGERLSGRELTSFCTLLLIAGQETTKNLIANFVLTLADHPEEQDRLVREPGLVPGAIEEVLRYLPPVWFLFRRTTSEVELSGIHIPENQLVSAWIASANRDSSQFPTPDEFEIQRDPNRHLTFGHGVHFCVGAPLTRLETKIALPMMLEELKDLRVVPNAPIAITAGVVFVVRNLPVTFQPA